MVNTMLVCSHAIDIPITVTGTARAPCQQQQQQQTLTMHTYILSITRNHSETANHIISTTVCLMMHFYQMPPRQLPTVARQGLKFLLKNLLKPPIYPQVANKFVLKHVK